MQLLLRAGADANAVRAADGRTFLECVLEMRPTPGLLKAVRTLLDYGAQIRMYTHVEWRKSPLIRAIEDESIELFRMLLGGAPWLRWRSYMYRNPLILAFQRRNVEMVRILLAASYIFYF